VLVAAYSRLVHRLAQRVYARRVGGELQLDDLIQHGMLGLLEAIDRFEPSRGVRFESFAFLRIEGAILNGLATQSELHRQLAVLREEKRQRLRSLADETPPEATGALERLAGLATSVAMGLLLDDAPGPGTAGEPAMPDNAYCRTELSQLKRQLTELMQRLPEPERHVLHRHYFQQVPFEQIAQGLDLSRGRISQLHHAALTRLKDLLRQARWLDASG
jgi:RNA polymerase sigma factor for flagellar operon FliA